jgi:thiol-disulfide isomerase/thioredoxin
MIHLPTKPTLLYLLIILAFSPIAPQTVAQKKAPNFTLTTVDGNSFTLSECSAEVVLVDIFATWCGPCREAIPTFQELYSEYQRNQLEIVSISTEDISTLENFIKDPQTQMTWIVVSDPTGSVSIKYLGGDTRIPHLYLVDSDGYIAYDHLGWREEDAPELRSRINSILLEGNSAYTNPNTDQSGWPITTIAIIVGIIICLFVGSILIAGYLLDWSSSSKKRSKKRKKRSKKPEKSIYVRISA